MSIWNVRKSGDGEGAMPPVQGQAHAAGLVPANPSQERNLRLKVTIHRELLDTINLAALEQMTREQIRKDIAQIVAELLQSQG